MKTFYQEIGSRENPVEVSDIWARHRIEISYQDPNAFDNTQEYTEAINEFQTGNPVLTEWGYVYQE